MNNSVEICEGSICDTNKFLEEHYEGWIWF